MSERMVCKHCASDYGFREVGTSRVRAWCDTRTDDGKLSVDWGMVEVDDFDASGFDPDEVECRECGASAATLRDLVAPEHAAGIDLEAGDLVTLPDGLRATVASVDREKNTFTVVGWHESFASSEAALVLNAPVAA